MLGEPNIPISPDELDPIDPDEPPVEQPSRLVRLFWPVVYSVIFAVLVLFLLVRALHAGGPRYVAGVTYFDRSVKGTPLTWRQGLLSYYTDQGDLSSILPGASADAFVADALTRWTSINTAAIAATRVAQLSEDVSGVNVTVNSDGSISMPSDILPPAVAKPVAIVYDRDGTVTDALLGKGAGGSDSCFSNAVFGGIDNFSSDAELLHALVVLNGNCAQASSQLPDVKYRLVRLLGRVWGLDWSQANLNVLTGSPLPTPEDYAGFPAMHAIDSAICYPISNCYANADQPKMDDRAAMSRLYPVTTQNLGNFPGKQLFYENTVRIRGSIHFVDSAGLPAQPMQGVNVVARWMDPTTSKPSRSSVAASVSGFLFRGNAGNPVTGYSDSASQAYDRFGSDDPAVEGFFDLAGLEIPNGANSAQYQLSVEAVDPLWSETVSPYGPWQVQPSGAAQPITVTVSKGGDIQQDILMLGGAIGTQDWFSSEDFAAPAPVPSGGEWVGSLGSYGESEYFRFTGQANRTLSVEVTALDERGTLSQNKLAPVVGMWALSDPPGSAPSAFTPGPFNTWNFGMSRLDANLLATTDFRVGLADLRGDGRPDYRYQARIFYGDKVIPSRASSRGGTALMIAGFGFHPVTTATVGLVNAPILSVAPNQLQLNAPAAADGVQSLTLLDPATGASSILTDALTLGAGPTDSIRLISGSNPSTPMGGEAPNPIRISVTTADGTTPVAGATVVFTAAPAVGFSACGGATTCTLFTDDSGRVSSRVSVLSVGTMTITASLAPASYPNPKIVQTTLKGDSSALDLALKSPNIAIAQGASLTLPLSARVLGNGTPVAGRGVNFQITAGSGTLTASSATTDANGYATSNLQVSNIASEVQVSACVAPGNAPCQTFYGTVAGASQLKLEPVAGAVQIASVGQSFVPLVVRVTDSGNPANPVMGAGVVFQSSIMRPDYDAPIEQNDGGDSIVTHPAMPVILASGQTTVLSDADGLASIQLSTSPVKGAAEIEGAASVGTASLPFEMELLWPTGGSIGASRYGETSSPATRVRRHPKPARTAE